jgi:hypothetical protein
MQGSAEMSLKSVVAFRQPCETRHFAAIRKEEQFLGKGASPSILYFVAPWKTKGLDASDQLKAF